MTIQNCSFCGGDHFGSLKCPFLEQSSETAPSDFWLIHRARKNLLDAEKTVCRWQKIVDRRRYELAALERNAPIAAQGAEGGMGER